MPDAGHLHPVEARNGARVAHAPLQMPWWRFAVRALRRLLARVDPAWRGLLVAVAAGALGALAVDGFRTVLFAIEAHVVGARGGHLVDAARQLLPQVRLLAPVAGALAAGLLVWRAAHWRNAQPEPRAVRHSGDYIEAVVIGNGRLDLPRGLLTATASLLVVSTGGAVGREGAMVLLAAMASSVLGRIAGKSVDLRLAVSCGAAAGLAAAYHAPLAGAMFVSEILLGSLALAQLGPVIVAAVVSHGVTTWLVGKAVLFPLASVPMPDASQWLPMFVVGLVAGSAGAGLLTWLEGARDLYARIHLPPPLAFALGGLIVGALSLGVPEVWGNGYSSVERLLTAPPVWQTVLLVLVFKLVAVGATTGSGAPGGVFTPTLFVGAAFGALVAAAMQALGATSQIEPVYVLLGMASLLAATTHAPVMAALMVFEMTGQYTLLAALLPACVAAAMLSRKLHPRSVYGLGAR
ncbi:MAG: chloride channel protein [Gemmatimonadota bacterium]